MLSSAATFGFFLSIGSVSHFVSHNHLVLGGSQLDLGAQSSLLFPHLTFRSSETMLTSWNTFDNPTRLP